MDNKTLILCEDFNKYHVKLSQALRKFSLDVVVTSALKTLVKYLYENESGIIFIDGRFSKYYYFLKSLATDFEALNNYCFIFLDNKTISYKNSNPACNVYMIDCRSNLNEHVNKIIKRSGIELKMKKIINENDSKQKINNMLLQLGFSPKYTGFNYIADGLFHIASNNFEVKNFSKEIYDYLGQIYNVNVCNIERNIKSATDNAMKESGMIFELFSQLNKKTTNRTVLSFLVEHLISVMGSNVGVFSDNEFDEL